MTNPTGREFSHVDSKGILQMVDVGDKPITDRRAVATGKILMEVATLNAIRDNTLKKGDVISTARIAGIMAAKRTAELVPLCHGLSLSDVRLEFKLEESLPGVLVEASVRTTAQTGVEMEALTAVTVALLTVYDMAKAVDRAMKITDVVLREKRGGTKGDYIANP
jgi:cyclic pyranopterin monophosphate synthase